MKDNKLLLSIIIPVFNRRNSFHLLISALSNAIIRNRFESHIEIIVVDDASTNPITLPKLPCKNILKRNQQNSGAPFSRNRGFKLSQGKFIHFHDSDDSIDNNWLFELINELSNKPDIEILVTGRIDYDYYGHTHRYPKFFHRKAFQPDHILSRLIYWNCIGPMGGVTFSRRVLKKIKIRKMASCQDWQMYIDAIKSAKVLGSRPDIQFLFHKTGNDRISHNTRKKILGHLQLARQTGKDSIFGRNIRLFYLYACKQHIVNQGGIILKFYKKHRFFLVTNFLIIAAYSFMPTLKK